MFPILWDEPFGMVMIEAMACGTPVVALRRGAVPEVVVDGVTGILCDDPAELPAAITAARDLSSAACRAHVETCFDAASMVGGYEAVYREALGRGCRGDMTTSSPTHAAPAGLLRLPRPEPTAPARPAHSHTAGPPRACTLPGHVCRPHQCGGAWGSRLANMAAPCAGVLSDGLPVAEELVVGVVPAIPAGDL